MKVKYFLDAHKIILVLDDAIYVNGVLVFVIKTLFNHLHGSPKRNELGLFEIFKIIIVILSVLKNTDYCPLSIQQITYLEATNVSVWIALFKY